VLRCQCASGLLTKSIYFDRGFELREVDKMEQSLVQLDQQNEQLNIEIKEKVKLFIYLFIYLFEIKEKVLIND